MSMFPKGLTLKPPSLLVSNKTVDGWAHFHSPTQGRLERCPNIDWDLIDIETGEVMGSAGCKTYGCAFCGPRRLWMLELALTFARPQRFVTLTRCANDKRARQLEVADLTRRLRGAGFAWEVAWAAEVNPKGTGSHIHLLQKGDYVPVRQLSSMWGGRVVHITALNENRSMASAYLVKEALRSTQAAGYMLKAPAPGSRPVGLSRGFWDGKTLTEVRSELRLMLHPEQTGRYVMRYVERGS